MSHLPTTGCRSCHEAVIWALLPSGKRCPMHAVPFTSDTHDITKSPPIYALTLKAQGVVAQVIPKENLPPGQAFYLSHFAVCPNAAQHSKKKA